MTRVLVVDDEPQILRALRINLRVRGYEVDTAATGGQALEAAGHHPPDLVILDLGLPDLDGVEVIGGLRGWTSAPIIVLSGRADSTDKVEALDAGADDYHLSMTSPAIDKGTAASAPADDLDGNARPFGAAAPNRSFVALDLARDFNGFGMVLHMLRAALCSGLTQRIGFPDYATDELKK